MQKRHKNLKKEKNKENKNAAHFSEKMPFSFFGFSKLHYFREV
jgi:hypothetical protein